MKRTLMKRLSVSAVTTAILFTTMFSLSVGVKAASVSFTPRLSAPESGNKYYYNGNYNIFYACGYGMPNCTAYAYGRAYEILGTEPNLSTGSAYMWYDYNRTYGYYSYGKTPKVGAVACWSYGSGGHVAVVEQIDSYGNMTLSNSAWGGTNFYLTYAHTSDSNPGGNSWWTFQGYIYLIDSATVNEPVVETTSYVTTKPATEPTTAPRQVTESSYKNGVYTVDAQPYLNMRSGSGLSYPSIGLVADNSTIIITNTAYADGYNWGYTNYNGVRGWVALEFCEYVSERIQPTTAAATTAPVTTVPATTVPATTVPATTVPATTVPTTTTPVRQYSKGDVNGDGVISILDVTMIQQYLAGMIRLSKNQLKAADFTGNGTVNIDDATYLQRYLLE